MSSKMEWEYRGVILRVLSIRACCLVEFSTFFKD